MSEIDGLRAENERLRADLTRATELRDYWHAETMSATRRIAEMHDDTVAAPAAPADRAAEPLAAVWTVRSHDLDAVYRYCVTEDAAKTGSIDCYEDDMGRCPDYGWRTNGPRLELLAGGEATGIYIHCHRVHGTPVDRAVERRDAAAALAGLVYYRLRDLIAPHADSTELRRMADEAQQAEPKRPPMDPVHILGIAADEAQQAGEAGRG